MKIKFLYITFNIVLIAALLLLFFTPKLTLSDDLYTEIAMTNNIFIIALLVITIAINCIFFINRKPLKYLEEENWKGLAAYLHNKIYTQKRISARSVQLLCDSLLLNGRTEEIIDLCAFVKAENHKAYQKNLLRFASSYVLLTKPTEARSVLEEADPAVAKTDWVKWYHAFTFYLEKEFSATITELGQSISAFKDPVVSALSIYLLQQLSSINTAEYQKYEQFVADKKNKLLIDFSRKRFQEYAEDQKSQLYCVIISSLIKQAEDLIYN
ncbi:MAG: hypothetical protein J5505_02005 [Spirochaetaceae bacterium]|nr:hypothetical protein [Spirochaetaceae bacterium]